jgi:hypothetical protein
MHCNYHDKIGSREYFEVIFDEGTCKELYSNIKPTDPLEFKDSKKYNISRILTDYITTSFKKIESKEITFEQTNIAEVDEFLNRSALTDYYVAKNFLETIWLNYPRIYDNSELEFDGERDTLYFQEIILLLFSISFQKNDQVTKLIDLLSLIDCHYMKSKDPKNVKTSRELVQLLIDNSITATEFVLYIFKMQDKDTNFSQLHNSALVLSNLFYKIKVYLNYKYDVNPIDLITEDFFQSIGVKYLGNKTLKFDCFNLYKSFFTDFNDIDYKRKQLLGQILSSLPIISNKSFFECIESKISNYTSYLRSNSRDIEKIRDSLYKKYLTDKEIGKNIPYTMFNQGVNNILNEYKVSIAEMYFDGGIAQIDYQKSRELFKELFEKNNVGKWLLKYALIAENDDLKTEIMSKFIEHFHTSKDKEILYNLVFIHRLLPRILLNKDEINLCIQLLENGLYYLKILREEIVSASEDNLQRREVLINLNEDSTKIKNFIFILSWIRESSEFDEFDLAVKMDTKYLLQEDIDSIFQYLVRHELLDKITLESLAELIGYH